MAAIALVFWKLPVWVVIPMVLGMGVLAGLITAFPVAQLKIPSFVASLAGWLIYRGALLLSTMGTGTIIIPDEAFNAIGNGFIPDIPGLDFFLPKVHKLTLLLGLLAIVLFIVNEIRSRRKKQEYNFEVLPLEMFILKLVFISLLVGGITWVLAGYNGLSWTVVIMLIVVAVYHFVTTQTVLGRHIYAVGRQPRSSGLSGINVKNITYVVFGSMGLLSALSGILFTSRLQSATTTAGTLFELDAIAAAYVGGVSAAKRRGQSDRAHHRRAGDDLLTSGMNLMSIDISCNTSCAGRRAGGGGHLRCHHPLEPEVRLGIAEARRRARTHRL